MALFGLFYRLLAIGVICSLDRQCHAVNSQNIIYFEETQLCMNLCMEASIVFHHRQVIVERDSKRHRLSSYLGVVFLHRLILSLA